MRKKEQLLKIPDLKWNHQGTSDSTQCSLDRFYVEFLKTTSENFTKWVKNVNCMATLWLKHHTTTVSKLLILGHFPARSCHFRSAQLGQTAGNRIHALIFHSPTSWSLLIFHIKHPQSKQNKMRVSALGLHPQCSGWWAGRSPVVPSTVNWVTSTGQIAVVDFAAAATPSHWNTAPLHQCCTTQLKPPKQPTTHPLMWFQLSSMRCFPLDSPAANSMAISISLLAHSGTKQHTAHNTIATVCVVCTGVVYNFPFVYQLPFILWPFIASFWNFRYVCRAASCASRVPGPRGIGYVLFGATGYG